MNKTQILLSISIFLMVAIGVTMFFIGRNSSQFEVATDTTMKNIGSTQQHLTETLPRVHGTLTASMISSRVYDFVKRKRISEGNTKGAATGVFAAGHIGYGEYVFGKEPQVLGGILAVEASQVISSEPLIDENLITQKISYLAGAVEILNVDPYLLMDQSANRFEALTGHIRELEDIRSRLPEQYNDLNAELRTLSEELQSLQSVKSTEEKKFFSNAKALLPQQSFDALNETIFLKERIAKREAQITALNTIKKYFQTVETKVNIKYTSLRANQEALIKGIQVVEIKDMKLDLIISEREWRSITGITD